MQAALVQWHGGLLRHSAGRDPRSADDGPPIQVSKELEPGTLGS
jgi:hypothetical protein